MTAAIRIPHQNDHLLRDNVVGLAAGAALFGAFFFIFNPVHPMRFIGAQVITKEVYPGNNLDIRWDTQWSRMCPGHSTRYAQTSDGAIHTLSGVDVVPPNFPGERILERPVQIPLTFAVSPGDATIWTVLTLNCWPWNGQTFTVTSPKLTFKVL